MQPVISFLLTPKYTTLSDVFSECPCASLLESADDGGL
jgi:hypothetical protein